LHALWMRYSSAEAEMDREKPAAVSAEYHRNYSVSES